MRRRQIERADARWARLGSARLGSVVCHVFSAERAGRASERL